MSNIYCPAIHNDLMLDFTEYRKQIMVVYQPCCLMSAPITEKVKIPLQNNFFVEDTYLKSIREKNKKNQWLNVCRQCRELEQENIESKRLQLLRNEERRKRDPGYVDSTSIKNLTVTLNGYCDLMCTTCSPALSSTWLTKTKQSKEEGYVKDGYLRRTASAGNFNKKTIIEFFNNLDLSELQQVTFTGGETVTFNYFEMIDYFMARCDPTKLSIIFQTNGVTVISDEYLDKLSQLRSVEVSVSIDCIGDRFNYLRRGADWEKVSNNILYYKQLSIENRWFFLSLEQTISVLSLFYRHQLVQWAKEHNVHYNDHLAFDVYSLKSVSDPYIEALKELVEETDDRALMKYIPIAIDIKHDFFINEFLEHITWYDATTGSDWKKTFPEIAQFYSDYI